MVNNVLIPDPSEKRISLVYNSDSGAFQALDFSKIDDIENILTNGINVNVANFAAQSAYVDAFGRQRISSPFTLADYSHVYGEETELLTKTSGNASSVTFNINKAKAVLTIGTGVNDYAIHQSRMYHHYMPGKSQLIFESFNFGAARSGTNKRIGLFDDYNGIFFQQSGDETLSIVLRTDISGSVQEDIIPQSSWNIDKCNGSGSSTFNLDPTKTQLFTADFQWLGVGRVRAGFVHNGNVVIAHEFYNSNNKDSVYWSNPNLPIRCELRNYASGAGITGSMDQICATVISEGGYNEAGVDFSARNLTARSVPTTSQLPLVAIALKTGYYDKPNRSVVRPNMANIYTATNEITYELWRIPSTGQIIGGAWVSANNDSVVQYNISATSVNFTSGMLIDAGYCIAGGQGAGKFSAQSQIQTLSSAKRGYISQNIDSTDSNVFVIVGSGIGGGASNTFASIQWRETR
ncbi:MAG: hypothetical protein EBV07_00675 [Proteobacteria bacterium]|nr:hypothetical protein [Pseudomonadota bacterium]